MISDCCLDYSWDICNSGFVHSPKFDPCFGAPKDFGAAPSPPPWLNITKDERQVDTQLLSWQRKSLKSGRVGQNLSIRSLSFCISPFYFSLFPSIPLSLLFIPRNPFTPLPFPSVLPSPQWILSGRQSAAPPAYKNVRRHKNENAYRSFQSANAEFEPSTALKLTSFCVATFTAPNWLSISNQSTF